MESETSKIKVGSKGAAADDSLATDSTVVPEVDVELKPLQGDKSENNGNQRFVCAHAKGKSQNTTKEDTELLMSNITVVVCNEFIPVQNQKKKKVKDKKCRCGCKWSQHSKRARLAAIKGAMSDDCTGVSKIDHGDKRDKPGNQGFAYANTLGKSQSTSKDDDESLMSKITMKVCNTFIQAQNQNDKNLNDRLCGCGYEWSQHSENARSVASSRYVWNFTQHTSTEPTNAFGELEFLGQHEKELQYILRVPRFVRVAVDTDPQLVLEILQKEWKIEEPKLLISVTGGTKNFKMKPKLQDIFKQALRKVVEKEGTWVMTVGMSVGVMKLVGEAASEYKMTSGRSLAMIGVAPWGCVCNKISLIRDKFPVYKAKTDDKLEEACLDPNHSYFILVDNGTQHQFRTEIDLRTGLEEAIGNMKTKSSDNVPVCLLVINGGLSTLQTVHSALQKGTPTVVIKGSGRVSDILAYAVQNASVREFQSINQKGEAITDSQIYLEDSSLANIEKKMEKEFGRCDNFLRYIEWIRECALNRDKISVFELDSVEEMDSAILQALLKANKSNLKDQLRLALLWNRIDVAKQEIFTDNKILSPSTLDDAMMMALEYDRVEFVQLFLDNGVELKTFLTEKRLQELYHSIHSMPIIGKLLNHAWSAGENNNLKHRYCLEGVGDVIQKLIGDFFKPCYPTNKKGNEAVKAYLNKEDVSKLPRMSESQQLFIWSVLLNRREMSFKFWRITKEPVAAALFAMAILKNLSKYTEDSELQHDYCEHAEEYEQRAIEVMNACYANDQHKTHMNLVRAMRNWGSTSCIILAHHFDSKKFLAHTTCQSLLSLKWRADISLSTNYFRILLCTICPLFLPIVRFSFDNIVWIKQSEGTNSEERKNSLEDEPVVAPTFPRTTKFSSFCKSPVVKFNFNVIMYFAFLALYSYIMLVKMEDKHFHYTEGILIVWVVSICTEELRQLSAMYSSNLRGKLKHYFYNQWNILDLITIVLFTIGMVFRFIMTTEMMAVARIILSINLITFFLRLLHIFSVNPKLGPMLVMISKMLKDLTWFVIILLVFVTAYAIASEAILYPNTELSWKSLYYLPRKAYWQMFGETMLGEIEGDDSCTSDPELYKDHNQLRCPTTSGKYVVPVLQGMYVMLTSVMLLNLLIAMFSNTFQQIQERSDIHWCYQRFNIVHEYVEKPMMPPPFILLYHIYLLMGVVCRCCNKEKESSPFRVNLKESWQTSLIEWENIIDHSYFFEKKDPGSVDGDVMSVNTTLDNLVFRQEELHKNLSSRLEAIEESLSQHLIMVPARAASSSSNPQSSTSPAPSISSSIKTPDATATNESRFEKRMENIENQLNWIIKSLQENNNNMTDSNPPLSKLKKNTVEIDC